MVIINEKLKKIHSVKLELKKIHSVKLDF